MKPAAPVTAIRSGKDMRSAMGGRRGQEVAVPGDGAHQTLFQREPRLPAEEAASLGRVEVLVGDLMLRLAAHVRIQLHASCQAEDLARQFEDGDLNLVAEVEGFP